MGSPWERGKGESEEAYEAFLKYRDMGPERTIEAVHIEYTKSSRSKSNRLLRGWSYKHHWIDRARAWDNHLEAIKQKEIEKACRVQAKKWARRGDRLNEVMWRRAVRKGHKSDALFRLPVPGEETVDDAGKELPQITPPWIKMALDLSAQCEAEARRAIADGTARLTSGDEAQGPAQPNRPRGPLYIGVNRPDGSEPPPSEASSPGGPSEQSPE